MYNHHFGLITFDGESGASGCIAVQLNYTAQIKIEQLYISDTLPATIFTGGRLNYLPATETLSFLVTEMDLSGNIIIYQRDVTVNSV